jgi:hypothetical protein
MRQKLLTISMLLIGLNTFAQLSSGLIAKYYFNNGNANDESGNGYNADTVTSVLTYDKCGNFDHAFSFGGTQFIDIPYSSPFNLNELSVSVWFKVLNNDSILQRIVTLPVGGLSGDQHFSVMYNSPFAPKKVMIYFDPSPPVYAASVDTVNDNLWHHFVGTISTSEMQVISYLDGIPQDTVSFINPPASASGSLQIGRFNYIYGQYFIGEIDNIRIYNRALSALEADSLFQEGCTTVGISSPDEEVSISVYPNPAITTLNIQNNSNLPLHFTLYNSMGEKMEEETFNDKMNSVDLSAQPSDIFFYTLAFDTHIIKKGKIIKR